MIFLSARFALHSARALAQWLVSGRETLRERRGLPVRFRRRNGAIRFDVSLIVIRNRGRKFPVRMVFGSLTQGFSVSVVKSCFW